MVYSTCSVLQSENAAMISDFVRHNTDASLVPFSNPLTGTSTDGTWQIFPGTEQMDGFFYAKLHKAK
jgi:16S rRNA (cytosine967-C5)-methyltransferase